MRKFSTLAMLGVAASLNACSTNQGVDEPYHEPKSSNTQTRLSSSAPSSSSSLPSSSSTETEQSSSSAKKTELAFCNSTGWVARRGNNDTGKIDTLSTNISRYLTQDKIYFKLESGEIVSHTRPEGVAYCGGGGVHDTKTYGVVNLAKSTDCFNNCNDTIEVEIDD